MQYSEFLQLKSKSDKASGFNPGDLHPGLFDFQKAIVTWSCKRGRAAIFADCGLGKSFMQLEWASKVFKHTGQQVLIIAPLAVTHQTVNEAVKFGYSERVEYSPDGVSDADIVVTNYERLQHFDASKYGGVVLDESSIIKAYDGKFKQMIIEMFKDTPYRLACTATPAPNDFMELGNHSEFLGAMNRTEMLPMFFIHDGGEITKWRLKGHAQNAFWQWVASWAVMIRRPSDLGFSDDGYTLPALNYHQTTVAGRALEGQLFAMEAKTLQERLAARRDSIDDRVKACADMVNADDDQWVIWCNLNDESAMLTKSIRGAVEVKGSDTPAHKEKALDDFLTGKARVIVSKPTICGFGLNWQHCHKMAFVGLSDSFEQLYQAVRRCWRFGQTHPVDVHMITADTEGAVVSNIKRKEADALVMANAMVEHMRDISTELITGTKRNKTAYNPVMDITLPSFITN